MRTLKIQKHRLMQNKLRPISVLLSSAVLFAGGAFAKEKDVKEEKEPAKMEFIRVKETPSRAKLQTSIATFKKGDVTVDLIGAVHIGDKEYFQGLNKEFTNYQVLLFEMVGGEQLVNGKAPKEAKQNKMAFLGAAYEMMQGMLELSGQKEFIDYTAKNFVHADLTMDEFEKLQEQRNESVLSFALKQALEAQQANAKQPDMVGMMHAILSRNPDKLKLQLIDSLAQGDDRIGEMAGETVIISDRNKKCLDVMEQQIKAGKTKLGIFYGAAHFPDMEKRLKEMGFTQGGCRWLTAWDVEKAKAIPAKLDKKANEKDEVEEKDAA